MVLKMPLNKLPESRHLCKTEEAFLFSCTYSLILTFTPEKEPINGQYSTSAFLDQNMGIIIFQFIY